MSMELLGGEHLVGAWSRQLVAPALPGGKA